MKTVTINGIQYTKEQFEIFARLGSYAAVGNLLKCGRARARIAMISLDVKFKKEVLKSQQATSLEKKKCINKGCVYYRGKRKNHCLKIPKEHSVEICECHKDDDGYSVMKPKGEISWPIGGVK